jgi:hypothetical protein
MSGVGLPEFAYAVPTQSIFAAFCGAQIRCKSLILLACPAGIEPATLGLEDQCMRHLSGRANMASPACKCGIQSFDSLGRRD